MIPPFSWIKNWWQRKRNMESEIDKMIEDHKEVTAKANDALNRMIAALDGEVGWFTCSCVDSRNGNHNEKESK